MSTAFSNKNRTHCERCASKIKTEPGSIGTGYAVDNEGRTVCYDCCGKIDDALLLNAKLGDKFYLYLTRAEPGVYPAAPYHLTNWPGTLRIGIHGVREGRHNMSGYRIDFWFRRHGNYFHGLSCSRDAECCTVTRVKG